MNKITFVFIAVAAATVVGMPGANAKAANITIQNNSFEMEDCTDLGGGQATGWNTTGGGVFDPQNAQFTGTTGDNVQGELPAGGQVGNVWFGLSQNLGVAAIPGATYTVNFYIGWRRDMGASASFRVELLEGANTVINQIVSAAAGGFAPAAPLSGVATGNGTLTLRFTQNTGNWQTTAFVDLVSLSYSLVQITNAAATSISSVSATFNSTLQAIGTNADVRVYWGTANGTNNPAAWTTNASVGSWTNVASTNISYSATGLGPGTQYYYTFLATNAATNVWASPSSQISTMVAQGTIFLFE